MTTPTRSAKTTNLKDRTSSQDLKAWLSELRLAQYYQTLVEQGFDDLPSLVQMMGRDRVMPLTDRILDDAGVTVPGHRARILVHLELAAGGFDDNQDLLNNKVLNTSSAFSRPTQATQALTPMTSSMEFPLPGKSSADFLRSL